MINCYKTRYFNISDAAERTVVAESLCCENLSKMNQVWMEYLLPEFDVGHALGVCQTEIYTQHNCDQPVYSMFHHRKVHDDHKTFFREWKKTISTIIG